MFHCKEKYYTFVWYGFKCTKEMETNIYKYEKVKGHKTGDVFEL